MDTYNTLTRGPIKSLQRGYSTASGDITINHVDMSKTIILINGRNTSASVSAFFRNRNTIYIFGPCDWQLIEFY